ncbi:MAG TPA: magnesium-translocating P-type ATPase [Nocardioides sp.]|uniref:magnesium-translocating P-type ATPase n=1 Tax=Nocardioides sp. TaxID=35761 RepID=UPI002BF2803A|nr:magnesium-translocating P-type ATPase [Nocardioides sp.]HQR26463.1 magnesium-translocating P-type ATPase [Nocardioides sp.]
MTAASAPPAAPAPWAAAADAVLAGVASSPQGLSAAEADDRLAAAPPAAGPRRAGWVRELTRQFTSPIVLILLAATVISMAVGDVTDGLIIIAIIVASGLLGFAQDHRAGRDVAALTARVQVEATVLRDGSPTQVPVAHVVRGDVVHLATGSVIPADCRLLGADELLVDESALTGESFPAEKQADVVLSAATPVAGRVNSVFFGTHVVSGTANAVALGTGRDTELGRVTKDLRGAAPTTAYERGSSRFGYLLVRLMLVLTVFIFAVNAVLGRPLLDSLLFSLALAVGLTPQMLPAIVTISLSSGARLLARRKVIVKRLEVIEDLGSMSILCTDKTGTLTEGAPRLDRALDVSGRESEAVLTLAALNAGLQDGFVNPMDQAIVARQAPPPGATALDQVPYDFTRKRLSVLTDVDGWPTLVTKGAVQGVLSVCTRAEVDGTAVDLADVRDDVTDRFARLSADGFRVLALATRRYDRDPGDLGPEAEEGLTLRGLLAFHDPVKATAGEAVTRLRELGVSVRLLTGDNALAARATAASVGLSTDRVLTGPHVDAMDDPALAEAVQRVEVFAEVEPHHKRRVLLSLRTGGAGVGFLGDGINDAPALHAADVGISVDTAVDVAKEAAAVVLLDKTLDVVLDGVTLGRRTFANTLKYVRLTTSANFGNMLAMAAASLVLPFLPLLPRQILLLNFLTDIPSTAIAEDEVDPEQTLRPASWDLPDIRRFLVVFGSVSTFFDVVTFAVLLGVLDASATEFRSAWFIESTVSELLVLFSLRTRRPMLSSRPARLLVGLSVAVGVSVVVIPFLPVVASALGLDRPGPDLLLAIAGIAVAYVVTNEAVKRVYYRRYPGTGTFWLEPSDDSACSQPTPRD